MKPLLMGDVIALARALRAAPAHEHSNMIAQIFNEAQVAAEFAKAKGQTHPIYGNGSVMAASAAYPQVAEPSLSDMLYCRCLCDVLDHVSKAHRTPSA